MLEEVIAAGINDVIVELRRDGEALAVTCGPKRDAKVG